MLNRHSKVAVRQVLGRAVAPLIATPLLEALETRSHFSVTPVANPAGPYFVSEGQSVLISGLTSTDADGTIASYQWDTDYSAGQGFQNRLGGGTWTFTADDSGTRTVALRVVDNDGDVSAISTATINIADVAPTLTLTAPDTAGEASAVNVGWGYTDPGVSDAVLLWGLDWGDGTVDTFAGSTSAATHTYAADGQYTMTLTATQADAEASVTHDLTVTNVTPIVLATTPGDTVDEGARVQMNFGSPNRGGSLDGWTIEWGDGRSDVYTADTSVARHLYTDSGHYTATVSAMEPDGGHGSTTVDYTVTNVAPTVDFANVPTTGTEGSAISIGSVVGDAGIDDTLTYGWTVYKDGAHYPLPSGTDLGGTSLAFTPTDNGSYVARLSVVDDEGAMTTVNSPAVLVANVNPTAAVTGEPGTPIDEGTPVTLTASAADPGVDDTFTYAWSVKKDGIAFPIPHGVSKTDAVFTFTPTDNGSYVATVVVTDNDGGTGSADSAAIAVANVAPTVAINGVPATGTEGTAIIVAADPHDAGTADSFTYTWSVEKDGQAYSLGAVDVTGPTLSFVPADNGSYVIHLDVSDDDGAAASTSSSAIAVANVAPTADLSGDDDGVEGSPLSYSVVPHDAGADDTHSYLWSVTQNGHAYNLSGAADTGDGFTFTPANDGPYVVSVAVTDDDGDAVTESLNVVVANAPPAVTLTGDLSGGDEGQPLNFGSTVTDPGLHDTAFTYAWTVKKGNTTLATGDEPTFGFTPDVHGHYTLKLTVTDADGGATTKTTTVVVHNVAPTNVTVDGSLHGYNEGDTVALTAAADDVAGDTVGLTWEVRDGDDVFASGEGTDINFVAARGDYRIVLIATDTAGAETSTDEAIHIGNLAPTADLTAPTGTMLIGSAATFGLTMSDVPVLQCLGVTWDFGDGTGASNDYVGSQTVAKKHAYAARGTYTVTATISDGLDVTVVSQDVTVSEAAMISDPMDATKSALAVVGSDAADAIAIAQQSNGKYMVTLNGTELGHSFSPTGRIYVYGNGGTNHITISGYTDAVVFAGGASSNVSTGSGNDIVIGSIGADRLNGGDGRDILIGNAGTDVIHGNGGDDLLIAGSVARTDTASLAVLLSRWTDTTQTLTARRSAVLGLFGRRAMIGDAGGNALYGDAKNDWMILNTSADRLRDLTKTDLVN